MEKVYKITNSIFGEQKTISGDNVDFRECGMWDSLVHMQIIAGIEEEFQVELTEDEIIEMMSISKIKELLRNKGISE
ncbi:MAG: acyl carrier protein [Candidatus Eremiobacterota bacterium]